MIFIYWPFWSFMRLLFLMVIPWRHWYSTSSLSAYIILDTALNTLIEIYFQCKLNDIWGNNCIIKCSFMDCRRKIEKGPVVSTISSATKFSQPALRFRIDCRLTSVRGAVAVMVNLARSRDLLSTIITLFIIVDWSNHNNNCREKTRWEKQRNRTFYKDNGRDCEIVQEIFPIKHARLVPH